MKSQVSIHGRNAGRPLSRGKSWWRPTTALVLLSGLLLMATWTAAQAKRRPVDLQAIFERSSFVPYVLTIQQVKREFKGRYLVTELDDRGMLVVRTSANRWAAFHFDQSRPDDDAHVEEIEYLSWAPTPQSANLAPSVTEPLPTLAGFRIGDPAEKIKATNKQFRFSPSLRHGTAMKVYAFFPCERKKDIHGKIFVRSGRVIGFALGVVDEA